MTKRNKSKSVNFLIFNCLIALTIFFNPYIQDPFNSGKQMVLILFAAWMSGYLLKNPIIYSRRMPFSLLVLSNIFLIISIIAAIKAENIFLGFFGEYQRRNGFITYFAFVLIFIFTSKFFNLEFSKFFIRSVFFISIIVAGYGFSQSEGVDFVKWNNPYNSIIGTLGNPNFASALMAILSTFLILISFSKNFKFSYRLLSLGTVTILILNIIRSQSRQGIIALTFGVGIGLFFILKQISRLFGFIYLSIFIFFAIFAIAGMLQVGPFTNILYKDSVSVRGFYWRAAIAMFLDHPLFGVGMDSYGLYFKQYREVEYVQRYGFNITSTNAHSVPLQILATSGIVAFTAYLCITFIILKSSLKQLKKLEGKNDLYFVNAIFAAWISYQAQSIISIDQIGLGIWGWVLGGILISSADELSKKTEPKLGYENLKSHKNLKLMQSLSSSLLLLAFLIPTFMYLKAESAFWNLRNLAYSLNSNSTDQILRNRVDQQAQKIKSMPIMDPYYSFLASTYQADFNLSSNGVITIKKLLNKNPRNQDYLSALAFYSGRLGNYSEAIKYRLEMANYDPFNADNYLELGRIYKKLGQLSEMYSMRDKIRQFAKGSQTYDKSEKELIG